MGVEFVGQAATSAPLVAPRLPSGADGPRLDVAWEIFIRAWAVAFGRFWREMASKDF